MTYLTTNYLNFETELSFFNLLKMEWEFKSTEFELEFEFEYWKEDGEYYWELLDVDTNELHNDMVDDAYEFVENYIEENFNDLIGRDF